MYPFCREREKALEQSESQQQLIDSALFFTCSLLVCYSLFPLFVRTMVEQYIFNNDFLYVLSYNYHWLRSNRPKMIFIHNE